MELSNSLDNDTNNNKNRNGPENILLTLLFKESIENIVLKIIEIDKKRYK